MTPPPPPPPPPPPMPGFGSGGPPPPPPPGGLPKPPASAAKGRGALLGDIEKGRKLKKVTQVNDRSAPIVSNANKAAAAPVMGAPPVPGMAKAPGGLAPPVPGVAAANRVRSSSDVAGGSAGDSGMTAAPQLGGLFAGGMPKLRKSGGVRTGADGDSPYLSDPEHSRSPHAPKPPAMSAPKPPGAPRPPGSAPPMPPPNPAVSALKGALRPFPSSSASTPDFHAKPKPPPIGKKPPIPPPTSRKPSMPPPRSASPLPNTPPPPPPTSSSPAPPAPPPPPPSAAPRPPAPPTNRSAPPPSSSAPPLPTSAPPPPVSNGGPSLAAQAARNAFGRSSPAAPPPPPPPAPQATPPASPAPPPPPVAAPSPPSLGPRAHTQPPSRSMLDPSSYTLTNGGPQSPTPSRGDGGSSRGFLIITDTRFKFQPEHELPKPRTFEGGSKRYRAGRGSTVPLDLSAYD